jgi:hypothetical protein
MEKHVPDSFAFTIGPAPFPLLNKEQLTMRPRVTKSFLCRVFILCCTLLALRTPLPASAGCGCDKPPPAPATVVPHFAFPGMKVTLFNAQFAAGQQWTVRFQNGTAVAAVVASVVTKRNLTAGGKYTPQLVATMPPLRVGPTAIVASRNGVSVTVPRRSFTTITKPVMASEQDIDYDISGYPTAVGADGTVYLSIGGLDKVCRAMKFSSRADGFPLRINTSHTVIYNHQGFLIDALTPLSVNRFTVRRETKTTRSDRIDYYRHSFAQYCRDHQLGGAKAVDPTDANWHRDRTPHVNYSTLVFAITGTVNGVLPTPGSVAADLSLNTQFGPGTEPWEVEKPEEGR